MKRRLALRSETLAELTPGDLTSVVGGAQTLQGATCPLLYCMYSQNCHTDVCDPTN